MRLDPYAGLKAQPLEALDGLRLAFAGARPQDLLAGVYAEFPGEVALVSSFGADAAVLLHMVSEMDRDFPVLMLETLMLFPETLAYQRDLAMHLGLRNVRNIYPDAAELMADDPDGTLNRRDPDACCDLRKVRPLDRTLQRWPVTISGRKRFQASTRSTIEVIEAHDDRLRINPLADWSAGEVRAYMTAHALPLHPLVARGYPSIGCAPCTTAVRPGEDDRAGRWRGAEKVECGIHYGADGRILRAAN
ncbi:MAG: phosphoadenylyl-sulfate reductase [Rhodobacteraceae bacterium]|nr:phosphoadenylyl-sulfate reductase [Paracoccaceae bacterium]